MNLRMSQVVRHRNAARNASWLVGCFVAVLCTLSVAPAWALSELKRETPVFDEDVQREPLPPVNTVPLPDPIQSQPNTEEKISPEAPGPDDATPDEPETPGETVRPQVDPDGPPPEIVYDIETLPGPVKRMRELILEAAKTGDIEKLRPLIGTGSEITQLSLGEMEGDPIKFLRELSGDSEGQEILAILEEVLSTGYVHVGAGTPNDLYVWPYFFAIPLDKLTSPQRVELFKIVTAGDYEDMKTYGAYIFYRVGITPEGRWSFFVAGD
jgi:hypothetical protein